jgi:transposase
MPWNEITRRHYRREGLRYASDFTDTEWSLIEPLIPVANLIGGPRKTDMRISGIWQHDDFDVFDGDRDVECKQQRPRRRNARGNADETNRNSVSRRSDSSRRRAQYCR